MISAALFWHVVSGIFLACLAFWYRGKKKRWQERLEEQARTLELLEEEMRGILGSITEGVVTLDESMHITMMNGPAKRLFALQEGPYDHKVFYDLKGGAHPIVWKAATALLKRVEKEGKTASEMLTFGEGEKVHLDLQWHVLADRRGYVLLVCDRSNHQKMLDMGKEFISNASHELRTPVTIIKGFAETLRDIPEISDVMFESIMEKMVRNCERMENLVKNLLRLTDLDQATLANAYECEVIGLIDEWSQNILSLYPEVRIEQLSASEEMHIFADPDLLELAVTNIMKNAIKYSDGAALIEVRIQEKKGRFYLQITDQGVGIPEDSLDRIFERFYTVDKARCRKLGGAGLGLSIVKLIIEKHEGKIWATSESGKGTTFHLSLPLVPHQVSVEPQELAVAR